MANTVSAVDDIVSEYQGIEAQMADPETAGDQTLFRKLSKRYAELQPIINVNNRLVQARADLADAQEMAHEDHEFKAEAERLEAETVELEEQLADLLAPRDPHDADDVIMEIKAGAGGEEAALFAGDLARMYERYADKHGLTWEVLGLSESDLGGVKDMTLSLPGEEPGSGRGVERAQVRGRRPPRAAGARHRVAGPHPDLRGRRHGLPGDR
ncbi:PCRF domain-containing protein [Corynebacterium suedekumii]|nr:PCRF domain-containing protein [Corynebacterium suedekumii]